MNLDIYQIDAFTNQVFKGNPACVIPLPEWLDDQTLLNIAKENAVAETAFFIENNDHFHLRWFTPDIEMDLCGHATLATAHVISHLLNYPKDTITFNSLSGKLIAKISENGITLNFPSRMPIETELPNQIANALNIQPKAVLKARDYFLIFDSEKEVSEVEINRPIFDQINLNPGGVIITAKGEYVDFVSRFFTPQATILEDPVTGSAHCSLIPYWSKKLGKSQMEAIQLSERGGEISCENSGDRVLITGQAKTYMTGSIALS